MKSKGPRKYTASDYLAEPVNFGGEIATRAQVLETLRGEGHPERCIQIYMCGLRSLSEDERFAANPSRVRHRELLVGLIAERMRAKPAAAWLAALEEAGVPCGPINDLAQVFADPQVRHRKMQVDVPHPVAGKVRIVANPMKLSATPVAHDRAPPLLGEHTAEVLRGLLGKSDAEIARLRAAGVI